MVKPVAPLIIGTLLCLALTSAATARDCRDETPLPTDVRLIAPAARVPPDVARFAGVWIGPWLGPDGDATACATLVVEEILPSGHARLVYSVGAWKPHGIQVPRYWRASGRIVDGELRFALSAGPRPSHVYRFAGQVLVGSFRDHWRHAVTRAPDLAGIGCQRRLTTPAASPVPGVPRDRLTAAELLAAVPVSAPVHNDYFLPVGPAGPARHALRGTLTIDVGSVSWARQGCLGLSSPTFRLAVDVVTHGDHLVPGIRTMIGSPIAVVLSPGRVWSEPGDQGMSRASLPFVVMNDLENHAYNGVATFLFDDRRVSAFHSPSCGATGATWSCRCPTA